MTRVHAIARERIDAPTALALAGIATGAVVGVGLAVRVPLGVAVLVAALYVPFAFVSFPVAVCLWIPLVFLDAEPAFNLAGKAAGLLLAVGWVGLLLAGGASVAVLARHRHLLETLGALIVWLTLSIAWAPATGQALTAAWQWWAVALVFVIVATSIVSERALTLAASTYIVGAVLAVALAAATGGLGDDSGRLEGAVGDPNFLASALVSAIPLALALAYGGRSTRARWLWLLAVAVMTVGVVASQSRGGLAAAFGMWLAAIVVLPRRRQVAALGLAVAAAMALAFASNPGSWERVTSSDSRGTGRVDLWTVAWNVFEDHPLQGVGLKNFGRVAPDYVREVGPLEEVELVVKTPDRAVHNSYLEFLAENGVVSLVLFVLVAVGCLRAALRAAAMFGELGRPDLVGLAHGLFVGTVGLLVSYVFLSGAVDRRLWILLGLSLAALEVAHRSAGRTAGVSGRTGSWTQALSEPGGRLETP